MNLLTKYTPKTRDEIRVNREQVNRIQTFLISFKKQKKNAILLSGPSGTGKTSCVYILAKDFDFEVLELNASDVRNTASLQSVLGNASQQQSLFMKNKILFIDEIEGISGQQDRGGFSTLLDIIEQTHFPVILTTNDASLEKLSPLLKKVDNVIFHPVPKSIVYDVLRDICEKERLQYKEEDLLKIAEYAHGDMRAAILDLQNSVHGNKIFLSDFGMRYVRENALQTTLKLFSNEDVMESLKDLEQFDEDIIDASKFKVSPALFNNEYALIYLLEENIKKLDAFEYLAKADIVKGRIFRRQYWRLFSYVPYYLAFSALDQSIISIKKSFRSPHQNPKLWSLMQKRKTIIVQKLAKQLHCSQNKVNKEVYPFLEKILTPENLEKFEDI